MTDTQNATERPPFAERYPIDPNNEGKTGVMHTLDRSGDSRVMWNKDDADDVALARRQFDDAKKKGYIAYKAEGKDGHAGEVIRTFDPNAERIILVKQHQGG